MSGRRASITRSRKSSSTTVLTKKKHSKAQNNNSDDDFIVIFKQKCDDYHCTTTPSVARSLYAIKAQNFISADIILTYDPNQNIEALICKHYNMTEGPMKALKSTNAYYDTLKILKLEFCNLTPNEILVLSSILSDSPNIKTVSVNGNPHAQNIHLLVEDNSVTNLSLRFCKINKSGMKKIANQLCDESETALLHLNLGSNMLFDEGAAEVARIFRVNRRLLSINLTDNKITDVGCKKLLEPLNKFALNHEDIMERRLRKFEYYMRRMSKMKQLHLVERPKIECPIVVTDSVTTKKVTKKESPPKKIRKQSSTQKMSKGNLQKRSSKGSEPNLPQSTSDRKNLMIKMIEDELGIDPHPFVRDSWEENKEIYCKGNFSLLSINLSYNKITNIMLPNILDTMKYQSEHCTESLRGLSRLVLDGNSIDMTSGEVKEIHLLLRRYSQTRSRASLRSKSSLASVTSRNRQGSRRSIP